jgi:hypothetical protein
VEAISKIHFIRQRTLADLSASVPWRIYPPEHFGGVIRLRVILHVPAFFALFT